MDPHRNEHEASEASAALRGGPAPRVELGMDDDKLDIMHEGEEGPLDVSAPLRSGLYKCEDEFYSEMDSMDVSNEMLMDLIDWPAPANVDAPRTSHETCEILSSGSATSESISTPSTGTPTTASPMYSSSSSASYASASPGAAPDDMHAVDDPAAAAAVLGRSDVAIARLELDEVFQLLWKGRAGQYVSEIPKRPQASPVARDVPLFYVSPGLKHLLSEAEKDELLGDPSMLVAVKYQGFSNGEIWWSKEHGNRRGIVARNMTRKPRNNQSSVESSNHGFAGRWYTLLERRDASVPVSKSSCRSYVIHGAPSLVQFWPASEGDAQGRADKKVSSEGAESDDEAMRLSNLKKRKLLQTARAMSGEQDALADPAAPSRLSSAGDPRPVIKSETGLVLTGSKRQRESVDDVSFFRDARVAEGYRPSAQASSVSSAPAGGAFCNNSDGDTLVLRRNLHIQGDLTIDGDLTARSLLVRGNLRLEGQLMTPPHAADYAEWFPCLDPKERIISGQVVQLRSPEQKITLDTSGDGPIMLVSTTPSVAAGVPDPDVHQESGALCGFLGQLPAMVRGPVRAGAHLFPSGDNDGLCVKGDTRHVDREPIGTAMESCGPGVHIINTFVRWPYNQSWQQKVSETDRVGKVVAQCWKTTFFYVFYVLCRFTFFAASRLRGREPPLQAWHMILAVELYGIWRSTAYFPVYPEYVTKGEVWKAVALYTFDFVYTLATLALRVIALDNSSDVPVSMAEMRHYMLDTLMTSFHIMMLILMLHNAFRTRQTLMQQPKESSATRAKWKKAIMKHFYTFM